jgi:hypothetical protein
LRLFTSSGIGLCTIVRRYSRGRVFFVRYLTDFSN